MHRLLAILFFAFFFSCEKEGDSSYSLLPTHPQEPFQIKGADISAYPEIYGDDGKFLNADSTEEELLIILKDAGINTIRLRLWVDPITGHSTLPEVAELNSRSKSKGFKTLIALHYSDTWAEPGKQEIPARWAGLSFEQLKDSIQAYTYKVAHQLKPDFLQLGNEINNGFLHPLGKIGTKSDVFIALLNTSSQAARQASPETQLVVHYAGYQEADRFFNEINNVDFDIIGLSYYPKWHGRSIDSLFNTMDALENTFNKPCFIAETAYPFTLDYNDHTHNVVGLESQLILPDYPATIQGQADFIAALKTQNESRAHLGICYWGAELIAWKGPTAQDASSWENQALFDFDAKATPALIELGR